jgi:hypothetical protein
MMSYRKSFLAVVVVAEVESTTQAHLLMTTAVTMTRNLRQSQN